MNDPVTRLNTALSGRYAITYFPHHREYPRRLRMPKAPQVNLPPCACARRISSAWMGVR